ncbi:MAG: hypothetical protein GTO41_07805, partial [Burkholderiales bacterium]|nr:hypothetical protein [Burkholderiales bacterium]
MADFSKNVILPVCAAECRKAQQASASWLRGVRRLLVRNRALLNERERHTLTQALDSSDQLTVVYRYKERLQR